MIHSLSKLGTFEKCAAKYKYQYLDRLPRGSSGPAATRGVDAHKFIEDFISLGTQLPAEFNFYEGWLSGLKNVAGIIPEAKLAFSREWEKRDWEDADIWWRGVLDLLIPPQRGTAHVYDWKTGKVYDDHEDQRQIYAIATAAHHPEAFEIACSHVYIDLHKTVTVTYHRDQLLGLRPQWARRFNAVETATEFPYNPSYSCRWCSYSKQQGGPCPF